MAVTAGLKMPKFHELVLQRLEILGLVRGRLPTGLRMADLYCFAERPLNFRLGVGTGLGSLSPGLGVHTTHCA